MTVEEKYQTWRSKELDDPDLKADLDAVAGKPEEINDRFYRDLTFGTAGLRGILGAGTNRMNVYTVRKATQGLANYLNHHKEGQKTPSTAIAYDSRLKSDVFAREAAAVLVANGVHVYLYPELMPTPAISFAVRYLHCDAGICVTASHNPSAYNGYKVYGNDGCQIAAEMADEVMQEIEQTDLFTGVKRISFEEAQQNGGVEYISESVTEAFLHSVQAESIYDAHGGNLKVVYTPLNGTGRKCVLEILKRTGVTDVTVVPEQEWPDGHFPTCPFPNPELREALKVGLALCESVKPDLLLATDPDCDRCGVAVRDQGAYTLLTGNEIGILLFDFIAKRRTELHKMPKNPVLISTIVSTDMTDVIAPHYGVTVDRVFTGFKNIGDQIAKYEADGEENRCIFSFEESNGYLAGTYVRDKDAVNSSMMICAMATYYKQRGQTLIAVLEKLYQQYGYYLSGLGNFFFEGEDGMKRMQAIMEKLRASAPQEIAGYRITGRSDYQTSERWDGDRKSEIPMGKSNVLEYRMENGKNLLVSPSGTEPKVKVYYLAHAGSRAETEAMIEKMKEDTGRLLGV